MGKGVMDLEMLIWRQVTPRWVNDPVWLHDGGWESGQGRVRAPPPLTENRQKSDKGGVG